VAFELATLFCVEIVFGPSFTHRFYLPRPQVAYVFYNPTDSGAVQLTSDNLDMTLGDW
jgi:hypothetical protein